MNDMVKIYKKCQLILTNQTGKPGAEPVIHGLIWVDKEVKAYDSCNNRWHSG